MWHWHAHAVQAIAFTPTGAQLLTGGEENVLVKWEVETGRKDFVPRLGMGGIRSIGVKPVRRGGDQEEYWVTLGDGSVMKNSTGTGAAVGVGRGVRLDPIYPAPLNRPVPLAFHIPSQSIVLPSSHPSTIQFFNPASNSVLFDLEVAPSNRVSRRDDAEVEPVRVERVVFYNGPSGKAEWMATSESRDGDEEEGGGRARAVKLWRWDGVLKT
jgi:NET1-associated nuclear protein 1 (U3 small nucleolar RNA-associated protein 17)